MARAAGAARVRNIGVSGASKAALGVVLDGIGICIRTGAATQRAASRNTSPLFGMSGRADVVK
jgi:hypothetical protein